MTPVSDANGRLRTLLQVLTLLGIALLGVSQFTLGQKITVFQQERIQMFTHSAVIESNDHVFVTVTVSNADASEAWRLFREECQRVKNSNVLT